MVYRPVSINPDQAVAKIQQAQQLGMQDATRGIQNIGQTMQFVKGIGDQQAYSKAMGAYLDEIGGEQPVIQPATGKQLTADEQEAILMQGGLDTPEKMEQFISDTATLTADNADPVQAANKLMVRAQNLESQGRDASDSKQLAGLFMQNPQAAKASIGNINQMIQNKNFREMLKRNPDAAMGFAANILGKPGEMSFESKERLKTQIAEDKGLRDKKYTEIVDANKSIDKNISGINKNYKNVKNLLDVVTNAENPSGARQAVYGLLVSLVKLGDPNSAVLASEAESALNIQGLSGALLSGDPAQIKAALEGKIDALDPGSIDREGIMRVANAYRNAGIDDISQSYRYTEEQRGLLNEAGRKFTGSDNRAKAVKALEGSKVDLSAQGNNEPKPKLGGVRPKVKLKTYNTQDQVDKLEKDTEFIFEGKKYRKD